MLTIRPATSADVPAIAAIYNEAVRNTTATFDTEEKTEADRAAWLAAHGERHPVIVAVAPAAIAAAAGRESAGGGEGDGEVVGWADLHPFSDRRAYADTAENSVYVRADWRGRGVGRQLLAALLVAGGGAGLHAIVARIAGENAASIRLHESHGFFQAGTLREVGRKFGRLLDVHLLEYVYPADPKE